MVARRLHERQATSARPSNFHSIADEDITMSMTGLDVFDRTIHRTNIWLKDVMEAIPTDDKRRAYSALRATLHAARSSDARRGGAARSAAADAPARRLL
jgi:hypothetical protein